MVSAYDCGQKRAKESVLVQIHVKPMCKPGWQGMSLLFLPQNVVFCLFFLSLFLIPFTVTYFKANAVGYLG